GSHLANDSVPAASNLPALQADSISRMEMEIDRSQSVLRPLKQFILPGGTETASRLHLARAIARRAERLTVRLRADSSIDQHILTYLNRLSDWLFVQARLANHVAGVEDRPWEK
ncbi:MAG: ATP:cob(I)alamin adenosyltransferase, partial [Tepidisphaeraceae bacterium]